MADQPVRSARLATGFLALVLGALVVLLAALLESLGWHPGLMHVIGAIAGTCVMLTAIVLVYRQTQSRRGAHQALQEEEARVAAIVESAMDAVIATDGDQRIVLFNTTAEKVFGWPRAAVLGKSLELLMPQSVRAAHHAHVERFAATGTTSRRMGDKTVLVGLRANGEEFPIEASISHTGAGSNRYFTVILRDVTERMNAERALRQSREELREMAAAAHSVREQEKSRLARELHDELAQSLTSLKMDLTATREELSTDNPVVTRRLDTMQKMLDGMVASTRRIASDLRPLMLDDLGLVPAAEWLTQNFTQRTGIGCAFSADPAEIEMQDPHATAVFRILQESLTNVARHAQASQVDVTIDGNDGEIVLRVRDNGSGFDPGSPRKPNSLGLVGLRERATLLGGEIGITAAPGKGTVVEVRIPMQSAQSPP